MEALHLTKVPRDLDSPVGEGSLSLHGNCIWARSGKLVICYGAGTWTVNAYGQNIDDSTFVSSIHACDNK